MGNIGRGVGKIAHAMQMTVLYNDLLPIKNLDFPATAVDKPTLYKSADILTIHDDATGRRALLADEETDQRGLAGAGRSDEEDEVAGVDPEVDVAQREGAVRVALADVVERDQPAACPLKTAVP